MTKNTEWYVRAALADIMEKAMHEVAGVLACRWETAVEAASTMVSASHKEAEQAYRAREKELQGGPLSKKLAALATELKAQKAAISEVQQVLIVLAANAKGQTDAE